MRFIIILLSLIVVTPTNTTIPPSSSMHDDMEEVYDAGESVPTEVITGEEMEEDDLPLPSTPHSTLEADDLLRSELVQNLIQGAFIGGFSAVNLLENLEPSDCLQVCLDEVTSMLEQPFVGQRSFDEVGNICSHIDVFQRCLYHNTTCKNALLGVTTAVFEYICNVDREALADMLPCLYSHSTVIYYTCDNHCKLGELLMKASQGRKTEIVSLPDDDESKMLETANLYSLCNSSACFANCTQEKVEKDCSLSRLSILPKIVTTIVNHTMTLNPAPGMKSSDAYTLLVSSILPQECRRLKLLPEDVVLTTTMVDSFSDTEYVSDDEDVQHKAADSGENEAIRSILDNHSYNQTENVYAQTFPLNGHQMKLQCQMIDLETGQGATVADVASLMSAAAKNIFNEFGFRTADGNERLENYVKVGNMTGVYERKTAGRKSGRIEEETKGASVRLLPSVVFSLLPIVLLKKCSVIDAQLSL